jgi:hypothetical protein
MTEEQQELLLDVKIEILEYITYNKLDKSQITQIAQILGIDIPEDLG